MAITTIFPPIYQPIVVQAIGAPQSTSYKKDSENDVLNLCRSLLPSKLTKQRQQIDSAYYRRPKFVTDISSPTLIENAYSA
jgi:hypothetical protein